MGGTSPAVKITKSECIERLGFEWKPTRRYFLSVVNTSLKLSPGRIIAWNGLTEGDDRSLRRSQDPHVLYNASRFPLKPHSWNTRSVSHCLRHRRPENRVIVTYETLFSVSVKKVKPFTLSVGRFAFSKKTVAICRTICATTLFRPLSCPAAAIPSYPSRGRVMTTSTLGITWEIISWSRCRQVS